MLPEFDEPLGLMLPVLLITVSAETAVFSV